MADALSFSLVEHDLVGKPGSTFPDHALTGLALRATGNKKAGGLRRELPEAAAGSEHATKIPREPMQRSTRRRPHHKAGNWLRPVFPVVNSATAATRTATRYPAPAGPMAPAAYW